MVSASCHALKPGNDRQTWETAGRFRPSRLVLKHVPVLRKKTVFEPDNVGGDPGCGPSDSAEALVRDNVITFGDDELILIAQCLRH